jgi:hypothetical protein
MEGNYEEEKKPQEQYKSCMRFRYEVEKKGSEELHGVQIQKNPEESKEAATITTEELHKIAMKERDVVQRDEKAKYASTKEEIAIKERDQVRNSHEIASTTEKLRDIAIMERDFVQSEILSLHTELLSLRGYLNTLEPELAFETIRRASVKRLCPADEKAPNMSGFLMREVVMKSISLEGEHDGY